MNKRLSRIEEQIKANVPQVMTSSQSQDMRDKLVGRLSQIAEIPEAEREEVSQADGKRRLAELKQALQDRADKLINERYR